MMSRRRQRLWSLVPTLCFLLLTAAVTAPWFLRPGFLFLLDFPGGPTRASFQRAAPGAPQNLAPLLALLSLVPNLLPAEVLQKLLVAAPILLSGVAATALTAWGLRRWYPTAPTRVPALSAGVFYALNPWVQTRIAAGAIYLLFGYALTPFVLLATLALIVRPSLARAVRAGLLLGISAVISPHHAVLQGGPVLALLLCAWAGRRLSWRHATGLALSALVLNLWWLAPSLRSPPQLSALPPAVLGELYRTSSVVDGGSVWLQALALVARWRTTWDFPSSAELLPSFWALWTLFSLLLAGGALVLFGSRERRPIGSALAALLVLGTTLGVGMGSGLTAAGTRALFANIPGWIAFRDTTKFFSVTALAEAGLLAAATAALLRIPSRLARAAAATAVLSLVLALASPAAWGFWGRIRAQPYPDSWRRAQALLDERPGREKVLLLPWFLYLQLPFTGVPAVANPARYVFDADLVSALHPLADPTHPPGTPATYTADPGLQETEAFLRGLLAAADPGPALAEGGFAAALILHTGQPDPLGDRLQASPTMRRALDTPELTVLWTP